MESLAVHLSLPMHESKHSFTILFCRRCRLSKEFHLLKFIVLFGFLSFRCALCLTVGKGHSPRWGAVMHRPLSPLQWTTAQLNCIAAHFNLFSFCCWYGKSHPKMWKHMTIFSEFEVAQLVYLRQCVASPAHSVVLFALVEFYTIKCIYIYQLMATMKTRFWFIKLLFLLSKCLQFQVKLPK